MPVTIVTTGVQYSGSWSLSSQANAKALGTWPTQPMPALYSWGYGPGGQLGLGNLSYYSSPKQVGALKTWAVISVGQLHVLSVKTDGTLWGWGTGATYGAIGLGNTSNYSSPKQIGALTNWLSVSAGFYTSAAVKTNGTLWSWGDGSNGQLGLGNTTLYSSPVQVGALTNWSKVSLGVGWRIAIKTDGTLWSWGRGDYGSLGLGNASPYSSPKQVGAGTTWLNIAAGKYSAFATKTDGTIWSWGYNDYGQLGQGNITNLSSPVQIGALTTWNTISSSASTVLSVKTDSSLWSWGRNSLGQLGLNNRTNYSSPKQVGSLTNWSLVSIGGGGSTVGSIKSDGTLWTWGAGPYGQLGNSNTTYYSSPKQVGSLTSWSSVSTGAYAMLGIANI